MGVSAIVVTFNREKVLKKCLYHLINQTYKLDAIIVINNNSVDGTKKYLDTLCKSNSNIIVKNLYKNIGGAGGFSIGTRLACELTNSEFLWLMDDDTMPTSNALKNLLYGAKELHNRFGFLCSNDRFINGYPCNIPYANSLWDIKLPSDLIRVNIATFVSFLVPRQNVYKYGCPIADMFIWGDDFEYSLRLSTRLPSYFVSNSIVIHDTKAFTSKNNSFFNMPRHREKYLGYSFRNELYAIRKHLGINKSIKKIIHESVFIIKIPFLSHNDRLRRMFYTIKGLIEGIFFNPIIKYPTRKSIKK